MCHLNKPMPCTTACNSWNIVAMEIEVSVNTASAGLIDEKGGQRELVVGIDDTLLKRKVRSIPREDVAELCIQSLELPEAENRSFDAISLPVGEGSITTDCAKLLADLKGNCDYSINSQMAGSEAAASATA